MTPAVAAFDLPTVEFAPLTPVQSFFLKAGRLTAENDLESLVFPDLEEISVVIHKSTLTGKSTLVLRAEVVDPQSSLQSSLMESFSKLLGQAVKDYHVDKISCEDPIIVEDNPT